MNTVKVHGQVDDNHRLTVEVPEFIPAGPVTVLIVHQSQEDDVGDKWMDGIAREWAADLADPRQDIYTLADGEEIGEAR